MYGCSLHHIGMQPAALCQAGRVYATATEDMDALTFGSPVMLKNLFDTESSRTQARARP